MVDTNELRELLARARDWRCTGDAMRCSDGNGCECAMNGEPPPPNLQDAAADVLSLLDDHDRLRHCLRLIVEGAMPATASGQTCFVPRYQIDNARALLPAGDGEGGGK